MDETTPPNLDDKPKVVTLNDIAKRCNVSLMTVSRALREGGAVAPQTALRIRAMAAQLGYNPAHHMAARRLAMQKCGQRVINHVIATIFPQGLRKMNYNVTLFDGILDELALQGYALLTCVSPNPLAQQQPCGIPPLFTGGEIDGLILNAGSSLPTNFLDALRDQPFFGDRPVIELIYPRDDSSNILVDGYHGAYLAAQHLLELGHRHILCFEIPNSLTQMERLSGITDAVLAQGLDPAQCLAMLPIPGWWAQPVSYHAWAKETPDTQSLQTIEVFERFLTEHPEFTALIAYNDPLAIQASLLLQRLGYRVPEDFSIVGFDDTDPLLDEHGMNMLTTVRLPLEDVGREAARQMIAQVESGITTRRQITLPTELVIRNTTGPRRPRH